MPANILIVNFSDLIKSKLMKNTKIVFRFTIAFDLPGLLHSLSDNNWHGLMMTALMAPIHMYFQISFLSIILNSSLKYRFLTKA